MTTTADTSPAVLYALGGGRGHAQRAAVLAGGRARTLILHQSAPPPRAPAGCTLRTIDSTWSAAAVARAVADAARWAATLIVDTFPAGVAGELDATVLARFRRTVLVQRYVRPGAYPDYDARAAAFDEHWLPYDRGSCEWDGDVDGRHVGPTTRRLNVAPGPAAGVAVIGDVAALPPGWRRVLPARWAHASGSFDTLPLARRYVSVGAGHNIVYELRALGARAAFVPLERRYDDQFRRADRWSAGIYSRADLAAFIGGVP